jgi:hypothetical protein
VAFDMIYDIYLTAIGLTPGGSNTLHVYTQTEHSTRNIHNNKKIGTYITIKKLEHT